MKKNFNSLTNHVNEMLQDRKELQEHERKLKEYSSARVQRTGNKPYLPIPSEYGIASCGCQICKRTYANIKETNAKIAPPLEFEAAIIARKAIELLVQKHNDYGPKNISDAPGGPLNGLSVRLHDKVARLNHLLSNDKEPQNESIQDTFIDILNYAIIALLVIDDKWDSTK
jgi:hypothetical protein